MLTEGHSKSSSVGSGGAGAIVPPQKTRFDRALPAPPADEEPPEEQAAAASAVTAAAAHLAGRAKPNFTVIAPMLGRWPSGQAVKALAEAVQGHRDADAFFRLLENDEGRHAS